MTFAASMLSIYPPLVFKLNETSMEEEREMWKYSHIMVLIHDTKW
ncbi:hypothetical protein BIFBRE_05088 [Bifidobacterium breve DSM 20213 = JCM 1192]|uniref:Uncharacterized protein n=1 Tax=Bifidobacterium breve DSM 20213 = JCM 1192 TaxID=518634 RepID=D4BSJ6_BIFBR|nr:hypothetical protein BIFBRE_05088 [Bifidobacterium breve DSM 20213 = JCM 1192]